MNERFGGFLTWYIETSGTAVSQEYCIVFSRSRMRNSRNAEVLIPLLRNIKHPLSAWTPIPTSHSRLAIDSEERVLELASRVAYGLHGMRFCSLSEREQFLNFAVQVVLSDGPSEKYTSPSFKNAVRSVFLEAQKTWEVVPAAGSGKSGWKAKLPWSRKRKSKSSS